MDLISLFQSKPVLIGLHLGSAIVGIDAFFWLLGKFGDAGASAKNRLMTAAIGVGAFLGSWLVGGYYYVVYYGSLVKPAIKASPVPWVHGVLMETKEHIFLFIVPLAITTLCLTLLDTKDLERLKLNHLGRWLAGTIAGLGLLIGAMGFLISAVARWGGLS